MLSNRFTAWLDEHADDLDRSNRFSSQALTERARENLFRTGLPENIGGIKGSLVNTVAIISEIAEHSLTAAFIFWGHKVCVDVMSEFTEDPLYNEIFSDLLSGNLSGSAGLSNGMKHISGLESIQLRATPVDSGWIISGNLPWISNIKKERFLIITVVEPINGNEPFLILASSENKGISISEPMNLMGMQGSSTFTVHFENMIITSNSVLCSSANKILQKKGCQFLALQNGMPLGLIAIALKECENLLPKKPVLLEEYQKLNELYCSLKKSFFEILGNTDLIMSAQFLRIRLDLISLALKSIQAELMFKGGKAYISPDGDRFSRRWRECAFLPIVTPSMVQLKNQIKFLTE